MCELDITQMLNDAVETGDLTREGADRVFAAAYEELRRLAEREMARERSGHTLQPTALVNEAYLKVVDRTRVRWESRAHFFGIAARAMRQVLVDHARARGTAKRGGGWERISLSDRSLLSDDRQIDAVELDQALSRLAGRSERMATIVELRVLGGLTGEEIARSLGVSRKTVVEDWRVAAMWLRAELAGDDAP